jgi:hypothetical protein
MIMASAAQDRESKRLDDEYAEAKALRTAMQQRHGMRSAEYAKADRALGVLWRQIKELKAAIAGPGCVVA